MRDCHFLLTAYMCVIMQSVFLGKETGCVGNPQENETNACCVQVNLGVSHKFGVKDDTDREPCVFFKISAHRA